LTNDTADVSWKMLPSASLIDLLELKFGLVHISGAGDEIYVKCPFCHKRGWGEDTSGHFAINFAKNVAHCVKCDAGVGGVRSWLKSSYSVSLVLPMHELSQDIKRLKAGLTGEIKSPNFKKQQVLLPNGVVRLKEKHWVDSNPFSESLMKKRISLRESMMNSLCFAKSGELNGHVVFPFIEDGKVVYYQGRAATKHALTRKYNPSKSKIPLGKNSWLYGYDNVKKGSKIYLVEGTLDKISLQTFLETTFGEGHYGVATQGTILSFPSSNEHLLNSQFGQLLAKEPSSVCVLFDPDAYHKAKSLASLLTMCGLNAYAGSIGSGDPNELASNEVFHEELISGMENRSEFDIMRSKLNALSTNSAWSGKGSRNSHRGGKGGRP
jgi:hypothetical protein